MLACPNFNETFHVCADASDKQLGGAIMQENKPLAFCSRKLNESQWNHTVGEKELLSAVEAPKEFKNALLGQRLVAHTDHKNVLCRPMQTERIVRWQQMLEECGPQFVCTKGEENAVADGMSRLHHESAHFLACVDSDFPLEQNHTMRECPEENDPQEFTNHCMASCHSGHAKDLEVETEFLMPPSLIEKEQKVDKPLMLLKMTPKNME